MTGPISFNFGDNDSDLINLTPNQVESLNNDDSNNYQQSASYSQSKNYQNENPDISNNHNEHINLEPNSSSSHQVNDENQLEY